MQNLTPVLINKNFSLNKIIPAIPAGMGTGAYEAALVCERRGQARACVKKGHTTS
jgi:hypothetical protein